MYSALPAQTLFIPFVRFSGALQLIFFGLLLLCFSDPRAGATFNAAEQDQAQQSHHRCSEGIRIVVPISIH